MREIWLRWFGLNKGNEFVGQLEVSDRIIVNGERGIAGNLKESGLKYPKRTQKLLILTGEVAIKRAEREEEKTYI